MLFAIARLALAYGRLVRRWASGAVPWKRHALALTVPAVFAALVALGGGFIESQVILTGPISDVTDTLTVVALFAAAAWASWIACWLLAEIIVASPAFPASLYDANLARLLARVGSLLSSGILVIYGATLVGVPALGLFAGVSIGGLALALAAQSTVENLLGGVSIFVDRPFRVGDVIRYGDTTGTVASIGSRSSRIRAADGTVTTVPNADLAKIHITNISLRDRWIFQHRFGVPRDLSRQRIIALLGDLQRRIAAHPLVQSGGGWPRVRLVAANDSTLEIEIDAQILTRNEGEFLDVQQTLILESLQAVETAQQALSANDTAAAHLDRH